MTPASGGADNSAAVTGSNRTKDREEFLQQACVKLVEGMMSAAGKQKNVSNTIKISLLKFREHLEELGKMKVERESPERPVRSRPNTKRVRTENSAQVASLAPKKKQKRDQEVGFTQVKSKKEKKKKTEKILRRGLTPMRF